MPTTLTPNMSLIVPTAGSEPGPDYANDINSDMSLLDTHDHSSGKGVPITPAGINISSDLPFLGNSATGLYSIKFNPGSTLTGGTNVNRVYVSGVDLYYTDGNNNAVRITQGGQVAGSSGNITGLVSPASVVYSSISKTFTFESDTTTAGNLDAGSITLREVLANAKGVTLSSPSSLTADYSITFPGALPASQKFVTLDASGNMAASWAVDNSTLEVSSNSVRVKDSGITTAKLADGSVTTPKLADNSVSTAKIINGNVTGSKLETDIDLPGTTPSTGGFVIAAACIDNPNRLLINCGTVNSNGTLSSGIGYSSVKNSTGNYTVTFTTPLSVVPEVIITPWGTGTPATGGNRFEIVSRATTGFNVFFANTGFSAVDTKFTFIAIGH